MVKLLIGGSLLADDHDGWTTLVARVKTLQESQHGPFAALFIAGSLFQTAEQYQFAISPDAPQLCVPTYLTSLPSFVSAEQLPPNVIFTGTGLATVATLTVTFLSSSASASASAEVLASLREKASHPAYRGCDLLLSEDWPKDMHHFVDEAEHQAMQACFGPGTTGMGSAAVASAATVVKPRYHFSCARNVFFQRSPYRNDTDAAMAAAASAAGTSNYGPQSSSAAAPCTRFISLAGVSQSKDKDKKWLHALSLEPIVYMSAADVAAEPPGTTDCPYVQVGSLGRSARPAAQTLQDRVASGEPDPKRRRGTGSGALFFGHQGMPRADSIGVLAAAPPPPLVNLIPPSISATTLFVGNTPKSMGGRDTSEIKHSLPGCISVRSQEGKAFVFADFESHDAALRLVEAAALQPVVFQNRTLSIGWASSQTRTNGSAAASAPGPRPSAPPADGLASMSQIMPLPPQYLPQSRHQHQHHQHQHQQPQQQPSPECRELYVGGLSFAAGVASDASAPPLVSITTLGPVMPGLVSVRLVPSKPYAFAEFASHQEARAVLENAQTNPLVIQVPTQEGGSTSFQLNLRWAKTSPTIPTADYRQGSVLTQPPSLSSTTLFLGGLPASAEGAVVDDEAVLALFSGCAAPPSLRRPEGKSFAFADFSSHDEAAQAMSRGGLVLHGVPISLGWAKGRAMEAKRRTDHEENCWFCLASPQLKMHLIMSVAAGVYLAMPRGAMHPLHCLLSPIECMPNRIHLPAPALLEMRQYEEAVETMLAARGMGLLRFERCIRTDGRDHMQQHLVPVPPEHVAGAVGVFLQLVAAAGLKFREMTDGRSVDETVVSMEGGPYQEYFFASLPVGSEGLPRAYKRFIFVLEEEPLAGSTDGRSKHRFPMGFGNDLAAQVLGQPERAQWKKCLVSQEEEERLAAEFREAFAPYDFTAEAQEE